MSKIDPIAIAKPFFEGKSTYEELFITSDAQVFTHEHLAEAHSPRLADRTITKVTKAEALGLPEAEDNILSLSIGKIAEALESITDLPTLNALKAEEEAAEKPRKGAIEAIDARIETLAKELEVNED